MRSSRRLPSVVPSGRPGAGLVAAGLLGATALLLSGCGLGADPSASRHPSSSRSADASPSPSASAGDSTDPSASASASAAPQPTATSTPVSIACGTLVSNQTVYDFNPIYSVKSPASIAAGSAAQRVSGDHGTVCQWENTSSGATITVSVGKYSAAALAALQAGGHGSAVSGWGDAGFYDPQGIATAFVGRYWITVQGSELGSADAAAPFVTSSVAAARKAG